MILKSRSKLSKLVSDAHTHAHGRRAASLSATIDRPLRRRAWPSRLASSLPLQVDLQRTLLKYAFTFHFLARRLRDNAVVSADR